MSARFEIVRSDGVGYDDHQYWHARFRAANGRIVWATEQYVAERAARQAVVAVAKVFSPYNRAHLGRDWDNVWISQDAQDAAPIAVEVRRVDERKASA